MRPLGYTESVEEGDEVPESSLQAAEGRPADHDHDGVDLTDESLAEHVASAHGVDIPDGLSFSTLQGMHDRFHGEAHAIDD